MTPIEEARLYIREQVFNPAREHPLLDKKIKDKVRSVDTWVERFERVGDLLNYLHRFRIGTDDPVYQAMHAQGLKTFEDIVPEFEQRFSFWANERIRISDFIVGEKYSSHQILIFARSYDTRSGGMFVLSSDGVPSAVVIKATLSGGQYANEWLHEPSNLKYYLKSINGKFEESFKANASIISHPNIPILTFVRGGNKDAFSYQGIFKYVGLVREPDGSKWFNLAKDDGRKEVVESSAYATDELAKQVARARSSSPEQRKARLRNAPKIPPRIQVVSIGFRRNPDVVAEVLYQAKGCCQACGQPAPFKRASDGTPYLEVHHRIQLALGGEDTVENAIALCPNCHRKAHFGPGLDGV